MLTGLHLLLTYRCTQACEHCFVFGSPDARGTFTRKLLAQAIEQARDVGTVEWIYFEGGEPFLHYPILLAGLQMAREAGFRTGVVTNAYWAETDDDAEVWLEPLRDLGVADFSVSDDVLHHGEVAETPAARALRAARRLGLPAHAISLPLPGCGEGVRFRGRAADRLVPTGVGYEASVFDACPDEDLADPGRVHLDAFGNVHLCQGVLLGNAWEVPLKTLLADYVPLEHPICGPLLRGGPAALAAENGLDAGAVWASACHLCFATRRRLRPLRPDVLGPDQVYDELH